jgi:hypothetical protein
VREAREVRERGGGGGGQNSAMDGDLRAQADLFEKDFYPDSGHGGWARAQVAVDVSLTCRAIILYLRIVLMEKLLRTDCWVV